MQFHIGDILGLYFDIVCYPNRVKGSIALFDFMAANIEVLPRLPDSPEPTLAPLLAQCPWLAEVDALKLVGDKEANTQAVTALAEKHGEFHEITPIGAAQ